MKTRSRKNMLHSALMLLAVMALIFVPFKASAEDAGIKVFMTVSNKGAIVSTNDGEAMAWKEVTVLDLDENGDYSFDEALVAAHKAYNSEAGYESTGSIETGGLIKKIWGIDDAQYFLSFINGEGIPVGVKADNVKEGDYLTVSTLADGETYGDWIAKFDKYEIKAATGEAVSLNVTGHLGMAYEEADKVFVPLKDIEVGVWKNGSLDTVMGKTDEAGNVSLTFDEPGTYVVTGKGTAKGMVTYWDLIQAKEGDGMGLPDGVYYKYDESFDSYFGVGYTVEEIEAPYPVEKVIWADAIDYYSGDVDGYLITSNQFIVDCPLVAPACIVTVTTPAEPADVKVTISNKGLLAADKDGKAMVERDVTVTDLNIDGMLSYDEALIAAHKAYNSEDGYATAPSSYGGLMVSKLWGEETTNTLFFTDTASVSTSVDAYEVKAGDILYASLNADNENWGDVKTTFDVKEKTVKTGEAFKLTLTGRSGVSYDYEEDKPLKAIQIGCWEGGAFKPIADVFTNENGEAEISFTEAGTYIVTAQGEVDTTDWQGNPIKAPTMAPYCTVTVESIEPAEPADVKLTINNKGVLAADKDGKVMVERAVTVTDLNKDGMLTYHEALIAAHKAYNSEDGYDAQPSEGYDGLQVRKLWGEETTNNLFYSGETSVYPSVDLFEVKAGDSLYASLNADNVNWADIKTTFDVKEKTVKTGDKFKLILSGHGGMSGGADEPLKNIQIGCWEGGAFKPIADVLTNENGEAEISFTEAGTYIVTAQGEVDTTDWYGNPIKAPTMAPYCTVTVEKADDPSGGGDDPSGGGDTTDKISIEKAAVTVPDKTYTGKALTPAVTVKLDGKTLVKDKDYTVKYSNNKNAGKAAKATITGKGDYTGTVTKTFTIKKAKQPMKVKAKNKTFKFKAVKKKKQIYKALTVSKNAGKVTYKVKLDKKAKKVLKFAKGKITVKKKAKKGTYKITITITAKGNANYLKGSIKKTIKVKVK